MHIIWGVKACDVHIPYSPYPIYFIRGFQSSHASSPEVIFLAGASKLENCPRGKNRKWCVCVCACLFLVHYFPKYPPSYSFTLIRYCFVSSPLWQSKHVKTQNHEGELYAKSIVSVSACRSSLCQLSQSHLPVSNTSLQSHIHNLPNCPAIAKREGTKRSFAGSKC